MRYECVKCTRIYEVESVQYERSLRVVKHGREHAGIRGVGIIGKRKEGEKEMGVSKGIEVVVCERRVYAAPPHPKRALRPSSFCCAHRPWRA